MQHVVANDCLFGYPIGKVGGPRLRIVVMRADIEKGGDPNLIDRVTIVDSDKVKIADLADYERFKIRP